MLREKALWIPKRCLLPPLCIKLGLMKQFVKALPKEGETFKYLCGEFLGLSEAKLKERIFVGPDVGKLMRDPNFVDKMETKRKGGMNIL